MGSFVSLMYNFTIRYWQPSRIVFDSIVNPFALFSIFGVSQVRRCVDILAFLNCGSVSVFGVHYTYLKHVRASSF